jgi:hypothetical protein
MYSMSADHFIVNAFLQKTALPNFLVNKPQDKTLVRNN